MMVQAIEISTARGGIVRIRPLSAAIWHAAFHNAEGHIVVSDPRPHPSAAAAESAARSQWL